MSKQYSSCYSALFCWENLQKMFAVNIVKTFLYKNCLPQKVSSDTLNKIFRKCFRNTAKNLRFSFVSAGSCSCNCSGLVGVVTSNRVFGDYTWKLNESVAGKKN